MRKKTTKKKASKKRPVIVHKFDFKSIYELVKRQNFGCANGVRRSFSQNAPMLGFVQRIVEDTTIGLIIQKLSKLKRLVKS